MCKRLDAETAHVGQFFYVEQGGGYTICCKHADSINEIESFGENMYITMLERVAYLNGWAK